MTEHVILAGLIGGIVWDLITWYFGLPTSSSHALIGGYAGAAIAAAGFSVVLISGWTKTIVSMFASPVIGLLLGVSMMVLVSWLFRSKSPARVDRFFRRGQLVSAGLYSLGHGGNDAQKTMGIIAILVYTYKKTHGFAPTDVHVDFWMVIACHAAIALGTMAGGWRIVKTMGTKITKLKPVGGLPMLAQDSVAEAESHLARGQTDRAVSAARRASTLTTHASVLFPAARVLLQAGRPQEAEKIASILDGMLQTHTTAYAQLIRAELAVQHGRSAEAIELFRDSIKRRDTWFARYLLGRVYAEAAHFPEALAELDACAKRYGEAADVFFYDTPSLRYLPPAFYWLARAQQAMGVADARRTFERFIALRGDADPPDPLAVDAARRLAN